MGTVTIVGTVASVIGAGLALVPIVMTALASVEVFLSRDFGAAPGGAREYTVQIRNTGSHALRARAEIGVGEATAARDQRIRIPAGYLADRRLRVSAQMVKEMEHGVLQMTLRVRYAPRRRLAVVGPGERKHFPP